MKQKKADLLLFPLGAMGYGTIEILWRGHTHWSMLCAGGICFVVFGKISEKMKHLNLVLKAVLGGIFITLIEFVFGIIFNVFFKKNVWDYSKIPFNFMGQICLLYSAFWCILSAFFIPIAGFLKNKISNK